MSTRYVDLSLSTNDPQKDVWVEERADGVVRLMIDFHGNGTREWVDLDERRVKELQGALVAVVEALNKRKAES